MLYSWYFICATRLFDLDFEANYCNRVFIIAFVRLQQCLYSFGVFIRTGSHVGRVWLLLVCHHVRFVAERFSKVTIRCMYSRQFRCSIFTSYFVSESFHEISVPLKGFLSDQLHVWNDSEDSFCLLFYFCNSFSLKCFWQLSHDKSMLEGEKRGEWGLGPSLTY